jgi:hypothetical protein
MTVAVTTVTPAGTVKMPEPVNTCSRRILVAATTGTGGVYGIS